jgi:hypothetical protein
VSRCLGAIHLYFDGTNLSTWGVSHWEFTEESQCVDTFSSFYLGTNRAISQLVVTVGCDSCGVSYKALGLLRHVYVCLSQMVCRLIIHLYGACKQEVRNWIDIIFLWNRNNSRREYNFDILPLNHFWQFKKKINILSIFKCLIYIQKYTYLWTPCGFLIPV